MFKRFLVGIFKDENLLLKAVRELRGESYAIYDVFSPYAIHGIDEAMDLRRSRLPWVTLVAGCVGLSLALLFQFWTSTVDWPINVGGKPDNSTLAFLPVAFEITVLFGGLCTVAAFFLIRRLFPGSRPYLRFDGVADDTFALVLEQKDASFEESKAREILRKAGAERIESRVVKP